MSAPPVALVPPPSSASGSARREPLATRRPVSTFVALLVAAALLLGTVSLTGVVVPRLETSGWADSALASGERAWIVEVHNAGLAPVQVEAATWPVHGVTDVELLLVRPGRRDPAAGGDPADAVPFAPFTLDGGEWRTVVLQGVLSCSWSGVALPFEVEALTLQVRSVLGRRQSIDIGSGPFGSPGGIPAVPEPCP